MIRTLLLRAASVAAVAAVVTLAVAGHASAHVTVNPRDATQGGYTKVSFRVPNETDKADTTVVEVNLPAATPIASVSLKPVAGWTAVAAKTKLATPIKSDDGDITEAVTKITWTAAAGAGVKPGQFQEFDVSLGPLPTTPQLVFKTLQTYSDGTIVRWIDAAATPSAVATVAAAAKDGDTDGDKGDSDGMAYGIAGIVLGLAGLALGALAYRRAAKPA
jgi:uncharacterized protein YcnI